MTFATINDHRVDALFQNTRIGSFLKEANDRWIFRFDGNRDQAFASYLLKALALQAECLDAMEEEVELY